MRVWFSNAPTSVINSAQKSLLALGIVLTTATSAATDLENYIRRYLDDPTEVPAIGPALTISAGTEDADTLYIRRYLGDPV